MSEIDFSRYSNEELIGKLMEVVAGRARCEVIKEVSAKMTEMAKSDEVFFSLLSVNERSQREIGRATEMLERLKEAVLCRIKIACSIS